MCITERYFMIEDQWNIIHLPYKPNGFGIMIIGDTNHYVDRGSTLWLQSTDRKHLIERLLEKGYTIFYSNLYGRHWGNSDAFDLCIKLYHSVINKEILNRKIHLLVEGMGGLLATKLIDELQGNIRSVAMINPCLYLKAHFNREKKNKLFYKRLKREISQAYNIKQEEVSSFLDELHDTCHKVNTVPTRIWHAANGSNYSVSDHSRCYESFRTRTGVPIELSLHLLEGKFTFSRQISQFFKEQERVL
jgi:uncharacterized protein YfbU (UPF0304 family)